MSKSIIIFMFIFIATVAYVVGRRAARLNEMDRWCYLLDVMEEISGSLTERDATYYVVEGALLAYDVIMNEKEIEIIDKNT